MLNLARYLLIDPKTSGGLIVCDDPRGMFIESSWGLGRKDSHVNWALDQAILPVGVCINITSQTRNKFYIQRLPVLHAVPN